MGPCLYCGTRTCSDDCTVPATCEACGAIRGECAHRRCECGEWSDSFVEMPEAHGWEPGEYCEHCLDERVRDEIAQARRQIEQAMASLGHLARCLTPKAASGVAKLSEAIETLGAA